MKVKFQWEEKKKVTKSIAGLEKTTPKVEQVDVKRSFSVIAYVLGGIKILL
jgi:hypothetical protein